MIMNEDSETELRLNHISANKSSKRQVYREECASYCIPKTRQPKIPWKPTESRNQIKCFVLFRDS